MEATVDATEEAPAPRTSLKTRLEDTLVGRHTKTRFVVVGVVKFKTLLTRFVDHSPLAFVDGEWGRVRWRTRRGSFVTDGTSLKQLDDQWKQDDQPAERVKEDGLHLGRLLHLLR